MNTISWVTANTHYKPHIVLAGHSNYTIIYIGGVKKN